MPIWFRRNGGIWNGNPSADPATGVGGISLATVAGQTLFPTVQGTGDASQTVNFGATAFANAAPAGFVGPPHGGGGFTTLDPTKLFGSGVLSGGNLNLSTPGTPGMAQSVDGYTSGKYYFEITGTGRDVFSNEMGGGVGRQYSAGNFNFWFSRATFGAGDANGGAQAFSGGFNTYEVDLFVSGATIATNIFQFLATDVIGIAFQPEATPGGITADMADFWFGPTQSFVDLSEASNRRLFIDANGCPLFLGSNGQNPFGSAPPVFLSAATGVPASFASNNGVGGAFVVSGGSLALSSGSPCCSITTTAQFNVPLGSDPQVRLSVSDDGGRTWNLVTKNRSIGKIGEYLKRLRWLKMGQFRQRVIKIEITDPVKRAFVGFYADTKEGME